MMGSHPPFEAWVLARTPLSRQHLHALALLDAYEIIVTRVETATRRGAKDPLVAVSSKRAGGNSRRSTNKSLDMLEYTTGQRRIVHRILTGTPSGFPGLLALYITQDDDIERWRAYLQRQIREYTRLSTGPGAKRTTSNVRSEGSAARHAAREPRPRTTSRHRRQRRQQHPDRTAAAGTRPRSRG